MHETVIVVMESVRLGEDLENDPGRPFDALQADSPPDKRQTGTSRPIPSHDRGGSPEQRAAAVTGVVAVVPLLMAIASTAICRDGLSCQVASERLRLARACVRPSTRDEAGDRRSSRGRSGLPMQMH